MRADASLSSDTARMAFPMRVRITKVERQHQHNGCEDDHQLESQDPDTEDRPVAFEHFEYGIRLETGAVEPPKCILKKKGGADGGDQRDQTRGVSQRAIGDTFQGKGDAGGYGHGHDENEKKTHDRVSVQEPAPIKGRRNEVSRIGTAHEYFAMGEVDHP